MNLNRMISVVLMTGTALMAAPVAAQVTSEAVRYDIPAGNLDIALSTFIQRSGLNVDYRADDVRNRTSRGVQGVLTAAEALNAILSDSGLVVTRSASGRFVLRPVDRADILAVADDTPEILVSGRRSQNVDIARSKNGPLPYVVIDAEEISKSQATDVVDLIRKRIPMNATPGGSLDTNPNGSLATNGSAIDLRGLGTDQTLILVDGRRSPRQQGGASGTGDTLTQGDINGIPLSAIERIEILPASAGGIYGGGAVGGVINVIRKRDYRGVDVLLGYDDTFHGGARGLRVEVTGGLNVEGGNTSVTFSGSLIKNDPLYAEQNNLVLRGRELYEANFEDSQRQYSTYPQFSGSPYAGYTPNIWGFRNTVLTLKNGLAIGGYKTSIPIGYKGIASDGGADLAANNGIYNIDLSDDARGARYALTQRSTTFSGNINIRRSFTDWLDMFADGTFAKSKLSSMVGQNLILGLSAADVGNPFNQQVTVALAAPGADLPQESYIQTIGLVSGFIAKLGGSWSATGEVNWARQRNWGTEVNNGAISNAVEADAKAGIINVFRDINQNPIEFKSYFNLENLYARYTPYVTNQIVTSLRIGGNLFSLPGGNVALTALGEYRREVAEPQEYYYSGPYFGGRAQARRMIGVKSGYAEFRVPIFSSQNATTLLRSLDVQASIRHDNYKTHAADTIYFNDDPSEANFNFSSNRLAATSYTGALRWSPVEGVTFRSSYATGFLPPAINQLVTTTSRYAPYYFDPVTGVTITYPVTVYSGGNSELKAEKSHTWSYGVILEPAFAKGLRLSADYVDISKKDEIYGIETPAILANPDTYGYRVTRNPDGTIISIDTSLVNLNQSKVRSLDFGADYSLDTTSWGRFRVYGIGSYAFELRRQYGVGEANVNAVGLIDGPLRWRGNAGIDWTQDRMSLSWNTQFYDRYKAYYTRTSATAAAQQLAQQGSEYVPSQMYTDISAQYRFGGTNENRNSGYRLSVAIQNLFDRYPPAVASLTGGYSKYGDPRLRRVSVRLRTSF